MFIKPVEIKNLGRGHSRSLKAGRVCKLIDILPASTISLTFHSGSRASTILATLEELTEKKDDALPNFKTLTFAARERMEAADEEIGRVCQEAGVDFVVNLLERPPVPR